MTDPVGRHPDRRSVLLGLAACGGMLVSGAPARAAETLVARSRRERSVRIYSNMAEYNWREMLEGFARHYPWISVEAMDMGPTEVFERYYAEHSARRPSADIIVSSAPDAWLRFLSNHGVAPYQSPEALHLPRWSIPAPGLYTLSADPMVMLFNKILLPPAMRPSGLGQLAGIAAANPRKFAHRITTYDAASHALAYAVHWSAIQRERPGGWDLMARLAPYVRLETGGAAMLDKVTVGEYLAAFHVSSVTVLPQMREKGRSEIVEWRLCADGTPVVPRGMAVTAGATSPASSRLLLDYLLSREGQMLAARGGLTPYRGDVSERDVSSLTFDGLTRRLGAANVVLVGYDPQMIRGNAAFLARWNGLFRGHRR